MTRREFPLFISTVNFRSFIYRKRFFYRMDTKKIMCYENYIVEITRPVFLQSFMLSLCHQHLIVSYDTSQLRLTIFVLFLPIILSQEFYWKADNIPKSCMRDTICPPYWQPPSQRAFTSSRLSIETLEKGVKYVQN